MDNKARGLAAIAPAPSWPHLIGSMPDTPTPLAAAASAFAPFAFDNSYARLPSRFFVPMAPVPVGAPGLVKLNHGLARLLGAEPAMLASPQGVAMLAGNLVPAGAEPLAMAYAGHQFGNWVPQLGDGRAILLGEVMGRDGVRRDIQLKGAGRTPFSRGGDGRAVLGPVLREYIVSEAMAALGVPTTRALAAVTTGEAVLREGPLPGAIVTRVAESHVRIGTFEYFANRGDAEGVRILADYVIARHYPEAAASAQPYCALLGAVTARVAALVAEWLAIGFIHGVMNTDNMSIAGETIDYGPCAFMDAYHPETVFSSIDRFGRYAYGKQPQIAGWNLARLGEALMPLFDENQDKALAMANESLQRYGALFGDAYLAGLRRKFGLFTAQEGDDALIQGFLKLLMDGGLDYTLAFRHLGRGETPIDDGGWAEKYRARLALEPQDAATRRAAMDAVNPAYIPRNHRVEAALSAAIDNDDYGPFEELLAVLARPFEERREFAAYAEPPAEEQQRNYRTY